MTVWRPVVGFEGHYEVSNAGHVRSLDRVVRNINGHSRSHKGRMLSPSATRYGYMKVNFYENGKGVTDYVHRVVAAAFIGPCPEGMEVDHIDNDSQNNCVENLTYITHAQNMARQREFGTSNACKAARGEHYLQKRTHCPRGHVLSDPNLTNYGKKLGVRICKACARAHSRVNGDKSLKPQFESLADGYYVKIMECVS